MLGNVRFGSVRFGRKYVWFGSAESQFGRSLIRSSPQLERLMIIRVDMKLVRTKILSSDIKDRSKISWFTLLLIIQLNIKRGIVRKVDQEQPST